MNEQVDTDIFTMVVDLLNVMPIMPPLRGDPVEDGIGEKTVTQSTTQGLKVVRAARSGLLWNGDISQNKRTVPILKIGLPSSAVWIVGVFIPIDVVGNKRQDHDIRVVFIQKM